MSSDYQLEDTLFLPFSTRAFGTGIPTVLVSGVIDIYEDVTATPIVTGETLTVSLGSQAGFNMITVTATAATGFEAGKSYTCILDAGTVDSVSVVGEVVYHFTLDMSAAAKDLANATDGLSALKTLIDAIKTETALIVADTAELQGDDVPGLIVTLDAVVDTVKAETALIVADTNELQTDDIPGKLVTLDAVIDTVKAETVLILADTADIQPRVVAVELDTNELQGDDVPGLIATLDAVVDTVKTETALIVADTTELQTDDIPGKLVTLDAVVDTVKAETALIVADTNELQTDDIPGKIVTLDAVVDTVKVDTAAVKVVTDKFVFTSAGRVDSNMDAINDDTDSAVKQAAIAKETLPVTFTTSGGSTTSAVLNQVDGAGASATDDVYNGRILVFNVGTLNHQVAEITDYDGGTLTATISAVTTAPTSSHTARMI